MSNTVPVNYDLAGKEIKQGDWIVQSFSLGRCASVKFAYVCGFAKSGSIRARGFTLEWRWDRNTGDKIEYWDRSSKAYSFLNPDRCFVVTKEQLHPDLIKFIDGELHGDPEYREADKV